MMITTRFMPLASLLFSGAIFGFFYAWVCSTMWGLDAIDPRVAITAMQGMNASVRNAVFFPAFFLTPIVLGLTGALLISAGQGAAGLWFIAGGGLYLAGGLILTATVNAPMNEALAMVEVPQSRDEAAQIWQGYSGRWQMFNTIRTGVSGASLLLAGIGALSIRSAKV